MFSDSERLARQLGDLLEDALADLAPALLHAVPPGGLGFTDLQVLRIIQREGDRATLDGVHKALALEPAAAQRRLDRLHRRQLIDRRDATFALTPEGTTLLTAVRTARRDAITEWIQRMDHVHTLRLQAAAHLLSGDLDALNPDADPSPAPVH